MLQRIRPLTRLFAARSKVSSIRCMGGHGGENLPPLTEVVRMTNTHMDNIPVGQGSWHEGYAKRQRKYNIMLAVNVFICVIAHYAMMSHPTTQLTVECPDYRKVKVDWDKPDLEPVEIEED